MKLRCLWILLTIALLLGGTVSTARAIPNQQDGSVTVTVVDDANLRAGPGTSFARVGGAKVGSQLILVGSSSSGAWFRTNTGTWIAAFLVEGAGESLPIVDDEPAAAPEVTLVPEPAASATPTPQTTMVASVQPRPLEVNFINPHYNCEFSDYTYEIVDGVEHKIWAYRSFQIDMFITNNSSETIEAPWRPTRWIITDGLHETVNDMMWEWAKGGTKPYEQPTIYPGQKAGWTWGAMPVGENEWVKAVEFYYGGHIYREEFDLGPYHAAYDYKRCGDYVPKHNDYPTPTPFPLWGE